jgi:AraC-like DNA-binding protein
MILRRFPGKGHLSQDDGNDFSHFHRRNVIVCAKSCEIAYEKHTAPLSIKSCLRGTEIYEINGVPIAVTESTYLVLNKEQPYASYIYSNETVESFCVFFRDGLETEVRAAFDHAHEHLLGNPEGSAGWLTPFFQNLRHQDVLVSHKLRRLHRGINEGRVSQIWLDEECNNLMEALLRAHGHTLEEIEKLPLIRRATRLEIFRRLCLAKDYIESCYDEPISLGKLARVACLSQHHFLRLFKAAFSLTPHQYLTNVRLQKALKLVREKDSPITDVCHSVGFEDPSSFTRLFKRRFHLSPLEMRRANQK